MRTISGIHWLVLATALLVASTAHASASSKHRGTHSLTTSGASNSAHSQPFDEQPGNNAGEDSQRESPSRTVMTTTATTSVPVAASIPGLSLPAGKAGLQQPSWGAKKPSWMIPREETERVRGAVKSGSPTDDSEASHKAKPDPNDWSSWDGVASSMSESYGAQSPPNQSHGAVKSGSPTDDSKASHKATPDFNDWDSWDDVASHMSESQKSESHGAQLPPNQSHGAQPPSISRNVRPGPEPEYREFLEKNRFLVNALAPMGGFGFVLPPKHDQVHPSSNTPSNTNVYVGSSPQSSITTQSSTNDPMPPQPLTNSIQTNYSPLPRSDSVNSSSSSSHPETPRPETPRRDKKSLFHEIKKRFSGSNSPDRRSREQKDNLISSRSSSRSDLRSSRNSSTEKISFFRRKEKNEKEKEKEKAITMSPPRIDLTTVAKEQTVSPSSPDEHRSTVSDNENLLL